GENAGGVVMSRRNVAATGKSDRATRVRQDAVGAESRAGARTQRTCCDVSYSRRRDRRPGAARVQPESPVAESLNLALVQGDVAVGDRFDRSRVIAHHS